MKLSDLTGNVAKEAEAELPYPCSDFADPPITVTEALAVDLNRDTTLCRQHRGGLLSLNVEGKVYFCPVGRMYWRYTKQSGGMYAPLRYPGRG